MFVVRENSSPLVRGSACRPIVAYLVSWALKWDKLVIKSLVDEQKTCQVAEDRSMAPSWSMEDKAEVHFEFWFSCCVFCRKYLPGWDLAPYIVLWYLEMSKEVFRIPFGRGLKWLLHLAYRGHLVLGSSLRSPRWSINNWHAPWRFFCLLWTNWSSSYHFQFD